MEYHMRWIHAYQLFLFDFDGLLVNSEELHFMAYKRMLARHDITLDWDFNQYCQAAHYHPERLKDQIYAMYPALKAKMPSWDVLYAQKKQALFDLLGKGSAHMMPGAEKLLKALENAGIKRCVVTHSPDDLVSIIRKQNPILDSIPNWITRHDYTHPKPNPECYQKAIARLAAPDDKIIGFEDTPRGLQALMATPAQPILISQVRYPEIPLFLKEGVLHYSSLDSIPDRIAGYST
jgi:HAD superfamily hydrolase (TIGR01509 family)